MTSPLKILVIRRDNIGDLVLTTPLFAALRRQYPQATLVALVNSYNAPAIAGNPDIDKVVAYTKGKHADGESALAAHLRRLKMFWQLRRERFDYVLLPNGGFARRAFGFARWLHPRHIVGFVDAVHRPAAIDCPVAYENGAALHEAEDIFRLLAPLGIDGVAPEAIPAARIVPDVALADRFRQSLPPAVRAGEGPLVALHISARKEKQRWPVERFAALAQRLHELHRARFLVFWSPGDENNPFHPGDDRKAAQLLDALKDLPAAPVRTEHLSELIAGLSLVDAAVLSDGGAMHIAAGLGKPIVCFFGNSSAERWRPWGVPYELLQKPSRDVTDIGVDETADAFGRLLSRR